jgi:uncharacterized repeat protein (TIGR04042 family)
MPETRFAIRWPDGSEELCYSPSTAIGRHLAAGESYPLPEFLDRVRAGLHEASDRVAAKYGFACSAALGELARIEARAGAQPQGGAVACLSLTPEAAR